MMKKPVIGITPSHNTDNDDINLRPTYIRAVMAAGGIPIVLPLEIADSDLPLYVQMCQGFLFSGGPDPHPFLFGEETQAHCGNVSAARDRMELKLLKTVMAVKKPVLGICRGIQIINVVLGGDIYQDLPSQVMSEFPIAHKQPFYYNIPSHHVNVEAGTLLSVIAGGRDRIEVNSMHHQSVRRQAPGLTVSGTSPDGVIEALEKPDYPFLLGVQWHPEYLWQSDETAGNIFSAFVKACYLA